MIDPPTLPNKMELFELLVESATGFAIFTTNLNGVTTTWNIGAERLFGFSETEMVGCPADWIFTLEDQAAGRPEFERKQAQISGRAEDERWHQRKDGTRFWASGLMMPLKQNAGFVKITRDRTEQHAANQQLRRNEESFRLLATSIPQMVFRTRATGKRTWGSPQWVNYTGLNLEASIGLGWLDAVHPDDRGETRDGWRRAVETAEYYIEHRIRRAKDAEYRWHQTRAKPLDKERPAESEWVGTSTDIHELRGLQDRQQMLLAELQHRTRNLLAVVGSIANRTARTSASLEQFRGDFENRLRALSSVQSLLSRGEQQIILLQELVDSELFAHFGGSVAERVKIGGPQVLLGPNEAQTLGLALHELTTNSVKYGALAQPSGNLSVSWCNQKTGSASAILLEWEESGVTLSAEPRRKGYGRELIERALPHQLKAKTRLEFRPGGVYCAISVPVPPERRHGDA